MSLRDRLNEDLKTAMRAKDAARLSVIRGIKAAILQAETRGERVVLDDPGIVQVIAKEVKERQDAIEEFRRGGRADLVDKLTGEIAVLKDYLPEPLSEAELAQLVETAISETGAEGPKDMGRVMGWLTPKTRGRADGKAVSEAVKTALQRRAQ
ncbi:GatB/YqeY domain-containing protein [Sulfobacillus harzensis]|uniref:GatB/YqeY domain-containing protein n=1 Tax=Sulfobacillus harzensis TaxID=2729629 RepID=A0A7Y0L5C5_9FIRM|nr:GatB/YqeY domain-containing protein [Sulfobacillus harzensis]NMP23006.1 GatB/YqeY domain-containing protein [Sulfobacillus harzensis]